VMRRRVEEPVPYEHLSGAITLWRLKHFIRLLLESVPWLLRSVPESTQ